MGGATKLRVEWSRLHLKCSSKIIPFKNINLYLFVVVFFTYSHDRLPLWLS